MFFKLQLLTLNIASSILIVFFLCLGSQNLNKKHSLNFIINKSVPLPIGFLVGTSFALGAFAGGTTSVFMITNKLDNKKN